MASTGEYPFGFNTCKRLKLFSNPSGLAFFHAGRIVATVPNCSQFLSNQA
jgi:hypothetical protein